ncbi:dephospho-CoA kinase, partial [Glutamicibacter creatinolyticus]
MIHVGLTGGIASGKSAVAAQLLKLGAVVIDADAIARQVVEPGTPALEQIGLAFGSQVFAEDGSLDRAALAAVVFADAGEREKLNAI